MNRLMQLLMSGLLVAFAITGRAEVTPPDVLARNTTNDVLRIVKQDKDLKNGNTKKILSLVEEKVLPNFDFRKMTQLAVGKNWGKATPEQQQDLVEQFKTMLVRTYSASLTSVSDYKIEFTPLKLTSGDSEVTVNTVVSKSGAPPIPIDYRMEKQDAGWKVFDVLVDNVSMVTVYRNTFNSEVRKGGIEGLVASLARRNQQPAPGGAGK
jgi:phospholipid transport system substrate-binding protein